MKERMFLCGNSVTAADIVVFTHIAREFAALPDFEKLEKPNVFRWLDHIQHLPGMLEQVRAKNMFVPFPDENTEAPSKA
jgi:glutathione S-transferase